MAELRDLYQEVVLDHNRQPRNFRRPAHPTHRAQGHNPLCGDQVQVYLTVADGRIEDMAFQGEGCAISTASASIMTEALKGRPVEEAHEVFRRFRSLLSGAEPRVDSASEKLAVLAGVRAYPSRVKCATLPWQAFETALAGEQETTTE